MTLVRCVPWVAALFLVGCGKSTNATEEARLRDCPDLPTWEACKARLDREASAAASATAAAAGSAAEARAIAGRATELRAFTHAVADARATPQKQTKDPDCDTAGQAGLCSAWLAVDAGSAVNVRYFKSAPTAVRFTTHFAFALNCQALDPNAQTRRAWFERPGSLLAAGGETCTFPSGALQGMAAVIENNRRPSGEYNAGVHVYTPEYVKRDKSFADAVAEDEARSP